MWVVTAAPMVMGLLVGWPPEPADAQTLRGVVVAGETQMPIELGQVTLLSEARDSLAATLTDEQGFFSVSAPAAGRYQLVATALGYRGSIVGPFELAEGDVRVVQIVLGALPVPLPGLLVSAERLAEPQVASLVATGFYDRLAVGRGEFLTPGEVAASPVDHTPQLFREMTTVELVASDWVVGGGGASRRTLDRASAPWNDRVLIRQLNPITGGRARALCQPRVYVDDVYQNLEQMEPRPSLEDLAPRAEIEAIEVYRAPFGAPMHYQSTSDCGVILIWTRGR